MDADPSGANVDDLTFGRIRSDDRTWLCAFETFPGSAPSSRWVNAREGAALAPVVQGRVLSLEDAPFAPTPSKPDQSWIYDFETDRGNQLIWSRPVGDSDFVFEFDLDWQSTTPELTLGGLALTNRENGIEMSAGFSDGWDQQTGAPVVMFRGRPGWNAEFSERGKGRWRLTRQSGLVRAEWNGQVVAETTMTAQVRHVALYGVRYRSGTRTFPFGHVGVSRLVSCSGKTADDQVCEGSVVPCRKPHGTCSAGRCVPSLAGFWEGPGVAGAKAKVEQNGEALTVIMEGLPSSQGQIRGDSLSVDFTDDPSGNCCSA
ncbi:MAG TPA: hypothetical protein VGF45_10605, partial [Polyangia bacterium]